MKNDRLGRLGASRAHFEETVAASRLREEDRMLILTSVDELLSVLTSTLIESLRERRLLTMVEPLARAIVSEMGSYIVPLHCFTPDERWTPEGFGGGERGAAMSQHTLITHERERAQVRERAERVLRRMLDAIEHEVIFGAQEGT